jgi:16S rRNA (guanine527-N7)-methyltransferase
VAREGPGETRPRNRTSDGRPTRSPGVCARRRRERRADGPLAHFRGGCLTRLRDPLPTDVSDLPRLPAGYADVLEAGLASLGLALDEPARAAIDDHVRLLLAWTTAINLTAIRDPAATAREHVLDSLTAVALLRERNVPDLLDLGSGGGFPGLPLAIALPRVRTVLVESVGKKARFLATVVDALGLRPRVAVAATRAETLAADPHHRGRWSTVVVRAVGPLGELAELGLPLLAPGGLLVAWKRRSDHGAALAAEIAAAAPLLHEVGGGPPLVDSVTVPGLADHVLVVVEKVGSTPPAYPRDPATRRRAS